MDAVTVARPVDRVLCLPWGVVWVLFVCVCVCVWTEGFEGFRFVRELEENVLGFVCFITDCLVCFFGGGRVIIFFLRSCVEIVYQFCGLFNLESSSEI